ncbi:hypothetical protein JT358_03215 [Micrococcales bacterium 31B]|nr:hypothetical protein [Micrococcales bacterium 31B]
MIAVVNRLVAALFTVFVLRDAVLGAGFVLVVMIAVFGVAVIVVQVVDVAVVGDGLVATVFAVLMFGARVLCVRV